jgi:pimeloyl-ACP methyl ester carboxylesterase
MPSLERPGGVRIHYELRGEGPLFALATYWSWTPGIYEELLEDLAGDHRVLTYHLRGTGESSRDGPYEMETDVGDLEALLELVVAVICLGPPLPRAEFGSSDALVGSESVVGALREMLSRDYRAAIRSVIGMANPEWDQSAMQQRVAAHVEFSPRESALGRTAAWIDDDATAEAIAIGDRLSVISSQQGTANVWFPGPAELERLTAELLPEARIVQLEDGPISRPDQTAAAIREMTTRI